MKTAAGIAVVYALVAAVGTVANIGAQATVIWLYHGPYAVELSVLTGTAIGFPIKYVLEKKYVFDFKAENFAHDTRLFVLYGGMGVFTTAIFWAIEFVFHYLFGTNAMRYLGGVIGLAIGSYVKYQLDKRFVFKREAM